MPASLHHARRASCAPAPDRPASPGAGRAAGPGYGRAGGCLHVERARTMQPGRVAGAAEAAEPDPMGRVWTVPNLISMARLAGVPVFLWLVLGPRSAVADWWAVGLLIAAGLSDWLDGKIARALGQTSRLGQLLDPAADRLYIVATVIALAVRAIIPWWLVIALAVREVVMAVVLLVLRRHGWGSLQVSFVGKAATLALLYAFPLLFLGAHP